MDIGKIRNAAQLCSITTLFLSAACTTDHDYDDLTKENGIDLTIGTSDQGISIPLGSLDKIYLTEILDTVASTDFHIDAEGLYYIEKSGHMGEANYEIENLRLNLNPQIESRQFPLYIDYEWPTPIQTIIDSREEGSSLADLDATLLKGKKIDCNDIFFGTGVERTAFMIRSTHVDQALLSLRTASFQSGANATFNLTLSNLPYPNSEYVIQLSGLRIEMPYYIKLSHAETGVPYSDGVISDLGDNGTITLTKKAGTNQVHWTSHDLELVGFSMNEGDELHNNHGTILRHDTLLITADATINGLSVSASDLVVGPVGDNGHRSMKLKRQVQLDAKIDIESPLLNEVCARFYPSISTVTSSVDIDMSDDVDFLRDNDVVLDVTNPQMMVSMHNPCPAKLYSSIYVDALNGHSVYYEDVSIHPTDNDSLHILFTTQDHDPANDTYANPNLSTLIQPIPSELYVRLNAEADSSEYYTITAGSQVHISADYHLYIPFQFNHISLTYDNLFEEVLDDDAKDYVSGEANAQLKFTTTSTLPLDVELELLGYDDTGEVDSTLVTHTPILAAAGTLDHPTVTHIESDLKIRDLAELRDLKLRTHIRGSGSELNAHQYLQLDSITLHIGSLVIDCNDK
ncbi:MAG: DUF4621 domain-containing protein [Bacteroidales bacterium]|nr:DUF4621 domain-containing protein [Bacteroidales bacterium]